MNDDLPAPLGPIRPTTSPCATESDTSLTATTLPYVTRRSVTSRSWLIANWSVASRLASWLALSLGESDCHDKSVGRQCPVPTGIVSITARRQNFHLMRMISEHSTTLPHHEV